MRRPSKEKSERARQTRGRILFLGSMLSVSRAVLVLVVACGGVEVFGACTCREDFAYFTEISNEAHYNYSDFPYLECVSRVIYDS